MDKEKQFMQRAIHLAEKGMENGSGGPFGAVIVRNIEIIGEGYNSVIRFSDPTAHAEILAIRQAAQKINSFHLDGCTLYTSCEPCPMCLGAIYWARIQKIYYACTRHDAAEIDFNDHFIYKEMAKDMEERQIEAKNLLRGEALEIFKRWRDKADKTLY